MSNRPDRIQGGVFVWFCALVVLVDAASAVARSYSGFWWFLMACVLASGAAWATYCLAGASIRRRAGSLEGERGPLIGLVVVGAAAYVLGFYGNVESSGRSPSYWVASMAGFLYSGALTCCFLWAGRGLNRYGIEHRMRSLLRDWAYMSDNAKTACGAIGVVAAVTVVTVVVGIVVKGLHYRTWHVVGAAVMAGGVFMAALAFLRKWLFGKLAHPLAARVFDAERFWPAAPCAIWRDSFSLPEYCAVLLFAALGVLTLHFSAQPFKTFHFALELSCGAAGFCALILIWYLDRFRIAAALREQWRMEASERLMSWREHYVDSYKAALKARVVEAFKKAERHDWADVSSIRRIADEMRRALNKRFCEEGRMRYISRYDILDRTEVVAKTIGRLFDEKGDSLQIDSGITIPEAMTDEQLLTAVTKVNGLKSSDSIEPNTGDVDRCASRLRAMADWSAMRPECRFVVDFKRGGTVARLELEMDERRLMTLSGPDVPGANGKKQIEAGKMFDVLDEVMT